MSKKSGFTPLFTKRDLDEWFNIFEENVHAKTYTLLQSAGEMFVKYARESGRYIDLTGNLRSSIGYVIVENGDIKSADFKISNTGSDGKKGVERAKKLARDLANTYKTGMVLVGVAGMEYAMYVEAMESKDVITAANIKVEEWMRKSIKAVFEKAAIYGRI